MNPASLATVSLSAGASPHPLDPCSLRRSESGFARHCLLVHGRLAAPSGFHVLRSCLASACICRLACPDPETRVWSGRRDSNPRHPAWKAGTLPTELHPHRHGRLWPAPTLSRGRGCLSRVVGREGFEPSKPEGRQIYSLMRLAASLPPRAAGLTHPGKRRPVRGFRVALAVGAGGGN